MSPRKKDVEPLARERIVAAAIRIIDDEGLEALSMRRLGSALGVNPMAAYYYVPNKAALYDLVLEARDGRHRLSAVDHGRTTARSGQASGARLPQGRPRASTSHPGDRHALSAHSSGAAAGRAYAGHPLRCRPDAGARRIAAVDCSPSTSLAARLASTTTSSTSEAGEQRDFDELDPAEFPNTEPHDR